jgi:hypothetical protein
MRTVWIEERPPVGTYIATRQHGGLEIVSVAMCWDGVVRAYSQKYGWHDPLLLYKRFEALK